MRHYGITRTGWIVALAVLLAGAAPAAAQPAADGGVARLTGWPAFLYADASLPAGADTLDLIPVVDTLTLQYHYTAEADTPRMTFALAWMPGEVALQDGERVPYGALPATPEITRLTLEADVLVGGRRVSNVVVAVDSVALGPAPDTLRFEAVGLTYANAFAGTPAEAARRYFERGFRLGNLKVRQVNFEAGMDRWPGPQIGRPRPRPRRPVYLPEPRVGIWIGGVLGADPPRLDPEEADGDDAPRGDQVGRGSTDDDGRRSRREGDRAEGEDGSRAGRDEGNRPGDDGEDEEEEESLVEEALIAASIVGLVAYGGGTVGYYGSAETPFGLAAGRVYPQGGALLQAGVSPGVLFGGGTDRLSVRLLGFYDLFGLPVQPAAGLGVVLTGRENTKAAPSLSLGAAGNFGRVVVLGGYDFLRGAVTFGVAVNFRFWRVEDRRPRSQMSLHDTTSRE